MGDGAVDDHRFAGAAIVRESRDRTTECAKGGVEVFATRTLDSIVLGALLGGVDTAARARLGLLRVRGGFHDVRHSWRDDVIRIKAAGERGVVVVAVE